MEAAKEKILNISATAKSGLDKTKAAAAEKVEKMKTSDPLQKEAAEQRKQEKIHQAELEKQQAYKANAVRTGEAHPTALGREVHGVGGQTGLGGHHSGVGQQTDLAAAALTGHHTGGVGHEGEAVEGHHTGLGGHHTAVGHEAQAVGHQAGLDGHHTGVGQQTGQSTGDLTGQHTGVGHGVGHLSGLGGLHTGDGHETGLGGHHTGAEEQTGSGEPTGLYRTDGPTIGTETKVTGQGTGGGLY